MSEWPQRYEHRWDSLLESPEGEYMEYKDFERLLEFAISAIQALGQTDRNREAIRHDILETMKEREWREKNG